MMMGDIPLGSAKGEMLVVDEETEVDNVEYECVAFDNVRLIICVARFHGNGCAALIMNSSVDRNFFSSTTIHDSSLVQKSRAAPKRPEQCLQWKNLKC